VSFPQSEPYGERIHEPGGWKLRAILADWTLTVADQLAQCWPEMPPGVMDRPAYVWEPMLAIADAAAGLGTAELATPAPS
jgi:hypothetical protein